MVNQTLATKVTLPRLRKSLVPRPQILRRLEDGIRDGHILTLVSAPAGYGKSTIARMWVETMKHPSAWMTLEKSDNDLKQFLTYFLAALQRAHDDLGQAALEMVGNSRKVNVQRILALVIDGLSAIDETTIFVLEDYHFIENERIDQFIELVLNQAIPQLHLVIITREDPNLPLTRLRVRNQLTELRAMDLSFSFQETDEFFANVMGVHLADREIQILKNRTEGWVAGLQLAALSIKESDDPVGFVAAFKGTHRHVLDYLIAEVLDSQSEAVRTFLRRTSILSQLSPALCQAVTGQEGSAALLRYLDDNNLFLVSLDEERVWYRYHALFRELLKSQLLQVEPELVDPLRERAVDWYDRHGWVREAIDCAFQLSNRSSVWALVEKHALPMLYRGEVSTVAGWFERVPESVLQSSPLMCIGRAWSLALMQQQARTDEVEQALRAAEHALAVVEAEQSLRNLVFGHSASIRAYLMQIPAFAGIVPRALIETSRNAQELLPKSETAIRSVNWLNIGRGYAALSDLPSAEEAYERAFEEGLSGGNLYAAVYGPINLAALAIAKGQLIAAANICERNIALFNRLLAGQRFPPIGDLYILKGRLLLEANQLPEAERSLLHGLGLVGWLGEYDAQVRGYAALARLRSVQGDWPKVVESIRLLEEVRPEVVTFAQAMHHRLLVGGWAAPEGSLEKARLWVQRSAPGLPDLCEISGIDPMGRVHFQTCLCIAHVLTRLAVHTPGIYPMAQVHAALSHLERLAGEHGLTGWLIELWIVKALMYLVERNVDAAVQMISAALRAAEPQSYFRVFLDEGELMAALLQRTTPALKDDALMAFAKRLSNGMAEQPVQGSGDLAGGEKLSNRELEVLALLAAGKSYKEIGQHLYLSLNTVQFHIKSIYGKLLVNRRDEAIFVARERKLI